MNTAEVAAPRHADVTRQHAVNWALGVGTLTLCLLILVYVLARALTPFEIPKQALWLIALAPVSGLSMGAFKLIAYTTEHRAFLYAIEDATGWDLDGDGEVGEPAQATPQAGTFLMGADGIRHRLSTELDAGEIKALKAYLTQNGKASVRGLTGLVGDRASLLRDELIAIGVCVSPRNANAAAILSDAGRKVVTRW